MPDRSTSAPHKNALEWSVFALSLVLVLGLIGTLAVEAFQQSDGPPDLTVEWDAPEAQNGGYLLPVRVRNTGPSTASDVQVDVTSGAETVTFTLQYVPRQSTREGAAFFRDFPTAPEARVRAFERP